MSRRPLRSRLRLLLLVSLVAATVPQCLGASRAIAGPTSPTDGVVALPATQALVGYRLIATMVAGARPLAVLRKANIARVVRRGDRIEGVEVAAVLDGRLLLRREGQLEVLPLIRGRVSAARRPAPRRRASPRRSRGGGALAALSAGVKKLGPKRYQIDRRAMQAALSKTHLLARTMRVIPVSRGGRPDGFRLLRLSARSPLRAMGLRRGDVLKQLNGRDVGTVEQLLAVYTKLRNASHLTVGLRRGGRAVSLDYAIR